MFSNWVSQFTNTQYSELNQSRETPLDGTRCDRWCPTNPGLPRVERELAPVNALFPVKAIEPGRNRPRANPETRIRAQNHAGSFAISSRTASQT